MQGRRCVKPIDEELMRRCVHSHVAHVLSVLMEWKRIARRGANKHFHSRVAVRFAVKYMRGPVGREWD